MKILLSKNFFTGENIVFATHGAIKAEFFMYSSGVEAIKITNNECSVIILPFQGQQIWDYSYKGQSYKMNTVVKEPIPTKEYLRTYGGFLYHCGIRSFGVPQADDNHPLHGETPNIEYRKVWLTFDENENGKYISVCGLLDYNMTMNCSYEFSPECRIYENSSVIKEYISIENMLNTPMEYMYLCHINFRPIDNSELISSAKNDSEHIKIHKIIPDCDTASKLENYINMLGNDISLHNKIGNEHECYDPEICFSIKYGSDENNRGYTLQRFSDGCSCYVNHPTDILPIVIRWMMRTSNEEALGMALPATAEHLGYNNAKKNGQIKILNPKEKISFCIETGCLDKTKTDKIVSIIEQINRV